METQVEKAVPAAARYYCPNPRCSKMLKRRGNSRKLTCPACKTVVRFSCTMPTRPSSKSSVALPTHMTGCCCDRLHSSQVHQVHVDAAYPTWNKKHRELCLQDTMMHVSISISCGM